MILPKIKSYFNSICLDPLLSSSSLKGSGEGNKGNEGEEEDDKGEQCGDEEDLKEGVKESLKDDVKEDVKEDMKEDVKEDVKGEAFKDVIVPPSPFLYDTLKPKLFNNFYLLYSMNHSLVTNFVENGFFFEKIDSLFL